MPLFIIAGRTVGVSPKALQNLVQLNVLKPSRKTCSSATRTSTIPPCSRLRTKGGQSCRFHKTLAANLQFCMGKPPAIWRGLKLTGLDNEVCQRRFRDK